MQAITNVLAGGIAIAALAGAAPAAAQAYPGINFPGYPPNGYGYYDNAPSGYGANRQAAVNQCANAVQARLNGSYGNSYGNNYGYGNAYGYANPNGYGGTARVLGISRVEPRSNGGLIVRGVATTGRYAGYGYEPSSPVDLVWRCKTDYRGFIQDIDVNRAQPNFSHNYTPWTYDYSPYGYRRY